MRRDSVPHCWTSINKAMLRATDLLETLVEARRDHDAELLSLTAVALIGAMSDINLAAQKVTQLLRKGVN